MAGDLLLQDPATVTEIKFAFFYCMFSFWSSGLLVLVCTLSEGVEAFGSVLHSANFLGLAALYELGKVWLAKLLSGHSASLSLSVGRSSTSEPRPIPARAPFLRRVWLRFVRVLHALAPLLQLLQGALLLAATWVAAAYFTVCFGAPLLSYWQETASFCLLVVLLTAYPCLLVLGPNPSSLHSLYTSGSTDTTPLPATLYLNSVCSLAGAWLGAVPLPLDWDRPWQAWPITCCLGAVAGHVAGNVLGACRVWPKLANLNNSHSKRKFV